MNDLIMSEETLYKDRKPKLKVKIYKWFPTRPEIKTVQN